MTSMESQSTESGMSLPQRRTRVRGIIDALFCVLATGCGIVAVAEFAGRMSWTFDLISHFRVQACLMLIGCTIYAAVRQHRLLAVCAAIAALVNGSLVLSVYVQPNRIPETKSTVRLLIANVYAGNHQHNRLVRLINEEAIGIAVVMEVTPEWERAFIKVEDSLPYRIVISRGDAFGIAILSSFPFESSTTFESAATETPNILARFAVGESHLQLRATHTVPPVGFAGWHERNQQFAELAQRVQSIRDPLILAGDLNCSPWSCWFDRLCHDAHLRDSRQGFGVQPSWPVNRMMLRIPIDHCLVSDNVHVIDRRIGPDIGSDHFPVICDLAIRHEPPAGGFRDREAK